MSEVVIPRDEQEAFSNSSLQETRTALLGRAVALADELARRPNLGLKAAPLRELERCAEIGLLTAPLPVAEGGLGLGSVPGTHSLLLRLLATIGGADLALGRILEGHVNGLLLVIEFGTPAQVTALAADVHAGLISGVWNTGGKELLRLLPEGKLFRYEGVKTFATGAGFVRRPIVTAEIPGRGWQMTLPHLETLGASIDRSFWHPLGMESSESFGIDFTGGRLHERDLIGSPGDFYRDPMFRGGAIRFAAVHAGAIIRLHDLFAEWLDNHRRADDPYQIARLGDIAIAAQTAAMWVERAATVAEQSFGHTGKAHLERMVECANMMRTAIERLAADVMDKVTVGVGAHGLLQPASFERILRDLTMYLRQPAPDATRAAIGRSSLEKSHRRSNGSSDGFWSGAFREESLPTKYFERIYGRQRDPWDFETSSYERQKYQATLNALPIPLYETGLEVGCSIGVLTRLLADRCDDLLSLDLSEKALAEARQRCQDLPSVRFQCARVPQDLQDLASLPDGGFQLIIVSEVAYYWTLADLERTATGLAQRHAPGGHLVLVHLTETVPDYPLTGDQVHDFWLTRPEWRELTEARHDRYRINVLERLP